MWESDDSDANVPFPRKCGAPERTAAPLSVERGQEIALVFVSDLRYTASASVAVACAPFPTITSSPRSFVEDNEGDGR
jgi:hypothetical protein